MNLPTDTELPAFIRKQKEENPSDDSRAYSLQEVADRLSVSVQTITAKIKNKEIRAFRFGRFWRVTDQELRRILGYEGNSEHEDHVD